MKIKKRLHRNKISLLGFGTWGLGSDAYGSISENKSIKLIEHSLKNGVNFFDTSNIYGRGKSETRIGNFIKKNYKKYRKKLFIATKCGTLNHNVNSWKVPQDFSISNLKKSIDGSLQRLNTNYIDLIQLHSPPKNLLTHKQKMLKIINFLQELKKKKIVLNFGVSVKSPKDAKIILNKFNEFNFIQLNFNLVDQRAIDYGILDLAFRKKVSLIVRTPFCFGYLASPVKLKKKDHRKKWSKKQMETWNFGRQAFSKISKGRNITSTDLALLYCTHHKSIKTVIPGMMTAREIDQNLKFLKEKKLSKNELNYIRNRYNKIEWIK